MSLRDEFMSYTGATAPRSSNPRPRPTIPTTMPVPRPRPEPIPAKEDHERTIEFKAAAPSLELVMYSEKSFAIFGDTKPVKDQLEGLYGNFNRYLKRDGKATPGYIFSLKRLDAVKKELGL